MTSFCHDHLYSTCHLWCGRAGSRWWRSGTDATQTLTIHSNMQLWMLSSYNAQVQSLRALPLQSRLLSMTRCDHHPITLFIFLNPNFVHRHPTNVVTHTLWLNQPEEQSWGGVDEAISWIWQQVPPSVLSTTVYCIWQYMVANVESTQQSITPKTCQTQIATSGLKSLKQNDVETWKFRWKICPNQEHTPNQPTLCLGVTSLDSFTSVYWILISSTSTNLCTIKINGICQGY